MSLIRDVNYWNSVSPAEYVGGEPHVREQYERAQRRLANYVWQNSHRIAVVSGK